MFACYFPQKLGEKCLVTFNENWVDTIHCWTFKHMNWKLSQEILLQSDLY